jgi:hypothetical protein
VIVAPGLNAPKQRETRPPQAIAELDPGAFPVTVPVPETPTVTVKSDVGMETLVVVGVATMTGRLELVVVVAVEVETDGDGVKATPIVAPTATVQVVPVPEQPPPLHEPTAYPAPGLACRVTTVPVENVAVQVEPQLIPLGELVTLPDPLVERFNVKLVGRVIGSVEIGIVVTTRRETNDAVTPAPEETVQVPVPEQAPLQPVNSKRTDAGFAVNVTTVPRVKSELHVEPQSIPLGLLVTLPEPEIVTFTE